jgi:hypothetical protein
VQLATTVPLAAAQTPITFLGALASTRSPLMAIGIAAASVTGPANAALTPLINNDVFLVVPKAFHALDVAIVEGFNVAGAVLTPGVHTGGPDGAHEHPQRPQSACRPTDDADGNHKHLVGRVGGGGRCHSCCGIPGR